MSSISKTGKISLVLFGFIFMLVFSFSLFFSDAEAIASDITVEKVIELANADRKGKGVQELLENEKLSEAAVRKAENMISENYFSHTSPSGITPWKWIEKENYEYSYAGENLAMDFSSCEKMNEAWLESPTHRANILNGKYKDIGVAVKTGTINGHETTVVVQMFGSGDKKGPVGVEKKKTETNYLKQDEDSILFPELPIEEEGVSPNENHFIEPVVTSPQRGENLAKRELEIFGRAKPESEIKLYDRENIVAESSADEEGWFRAKISGLEEGEHTLKLESVAMIGRKKESRFSDSEVSFFVDTEKPKIRYQLIGGETGNKVLIGISSNKPNCVLEVGGERIFSGQKRTAFVSVEKDKLSVSLSARDVAGNRAYKGIDLSSYYLPTKSFDITKTISAAMLPRDVFAAESGREAIKDNLGITPHRFQNDMTEEKVVMSHF